MCIIDKTRIKTLFLDYDGCLHNSLVIYAPAFRKAYAFLVEFGLAEPRDWQDHEITPWLGYNSQEMWEHFQPGLAATVRQHCMALVSTEMQRQIKEGRPELYPGALETLATLKSRGYHLVFISNCRTYYRDSQNQLFGLDHYFEELACSEAYGYTSKTEILRLIRPRYPEGQVMIGDRAIDLAAGKGNGLLTIGCTYGFAQPGELDGADLLIDDIRELAAIF